jgi:hypothetical protein
MEVSGQLHASAALTQLEKPPISIIYVAEWVAESVWTLWRREKNLALT